MRNSPHCLRSVGIVWSGNYFLRRRLNRTGGACGYIVVRSMRPATAQSRAQPHQQPFAIHDQLLNTTISTKGRRRTLFHLEDLPPLPNDDLNWLTPDKVNNAL